jgi:hypothetical protein
MPGTAGLRRHQSHPAARNDARWSSDNTAILALIVNLLAGRL